MSTDLRFSLAPESINLLQEALLCLAKFGDSVGFDARKDKLILACTNLSRTAYAGFTFDAKTFFIDYHANINNTEQKFTCQLYNKALQSAFRSRASEIRGREGLIDRCDVSVQDRPDNPECRLVIKTHYKHGVTKSYRLTYESMHVMHALFDRHSTSQGWRISSRIMREYIEYFGAKTEQLDIAAQDGKAVFTSFTEKIQDGKAILKQPLETSITLHTDDFEDFHMIESLHIIVGVKDFKSIVTHAETLHGPMSAYFSTPSRPFQLSYQTRGMRCNYTLTTGGAHGQSEIDRNVYVSTRTGPRMTSQHLGTAMDQSQQPSLSMNGQPQPDLGMTSQSQQPAHNTAMPPPPRNNSRTLTLGSQSQAKRVRPTHDPTLTQDEQDPESLFVPLDEDQAWEPPNYDMEEQEEMLGYDASYHNTQTVPHATFRDSFSQTNRQISLLSAASEESQEGLEPTQRLSQLHGMFD